MTTTAATFEKELTEILSPDFTCPGCVEKDKAIVNCYDILEKRNEELDEKDGGPEIRASVLWFAEMMELNLLANDHKGGWENETCEYLSGRFVEEVYEFIDAMDSCNASDIIHEAADVANFAMMLADRVR